MPSSSARCAQLPRAMDKVPYYIGLKKLRDYLRGDLATLDDNEIIFPNVPLEHKLKIADVKEETTNLDIDEASTSSQGAKELTLEQIQMQTEYQEALMASAEGMDLSQEEWAQGHSSLNTRKSTKNGDYHYNLPSGFSPLDSSFQPLLSGQISNKNQSGKDSTSSSSAVKQEFPFDADEYESVAVRGPTAQKVNLESNFLDPYQCHISSAPQYISLGDLPSKSKSGKNFQKDQRLMSNNQCSNANRPSPLHHAQQHSLTRVLHSQYPHQVTGLMGLKQASLSDHNLLA